MQCNPITIASGFTDLRSSISLIVISTIFKCPPTKSINFHLNCHDKPELNLEENYLSHRCRRFVGRRPPATHSVRQPAARRRNLCGNAAPFAAHSSAPAAPSIVQPVHGAAACGRPIVAQPCAKQRPTLGAKRGKRAVIARACARGGRWGATPYAAAPRPDPSLSSDTTVGDNGGSGSRFPGAPRHADRNKSDHDHRRRAAAQELADGRECLCENHESSTCVTLNDSGIQLAVGPQPLRLRNHNFGLAHRIMVKRLATSPHDPLCITDSACKNQLVMVSVQYGPFNTYIPIRSTTIGTSGNQAGQSGGSTGRSPRP
ncbi:hypothetical protein F511_19171 [Dorcoceras hygrometricum]|uniref:Uncharacterized protein n=1 Tax=Dorcoceras hygrometricum TaxID=472368 RepID=A0A2Z7DC65_9LAMI|nr:hypothetical protein F511_19171 [Dorcoceras hygrometricum]